MCGIAGIIDLRGRRPVNRKALERMSAALTHRGPDGDGFFHEDGIGLAHRRLAIIDIKGGAQPFRVEGGALTFNGEIYNHEALGRALSEDGVRLRTRSDTEVLAEGLAREGGDFVQKLRGMFAFAYWDKERRQLTLARDRLGEKPLYYAETSDGFLIFASEMKALARSELLTLRKCPKAIADYLYYGYIPDPRTIYRGVCKLPPAHMLTLKSGVTPEPVRYWRPVFADANGFSFEEAAHLLAEQIDDAVASQLISDVPIGAFLSGGVDSAGIVAAMANARGSPVTCTIGFEEGSHDERSGAREIAEKFGAVHHEHVANLNAADLIDTVAGVCGEPFADSSALPSYLLSGLARRHVTVALSGDGGDEIFGGYRRYPFFLAEERLRRMAPEFIRALAFRPLGALYPKLDWAPRMFRAKTTLQALGASRGAAYASAVAINLPARANAMLSENLKSTLDGYRPERIIIDAMAEANTDDPLAQAQYADLQTWLPGRMLTKIDRASMAHSLEVRPPLLDHRLVEWAGLLPSRFKVGDGERKRVLKAAFSPRLTSEYVNRRKRGFDVPVSAWMAEDDSPLTRRIATSKTWRKSGLLDVAFVDRMLAAHRSGRADCGQELWTVLMLDAFLKSEEVAS